MMADIKRAQDQLFDRRQSAREKYASLVVGRPGWGALLKHELVTLAGAAACRARSGFALRKALYPSLLGACGRNVVFGQNVVLRHPHKIRIGDNVVIDDNCLLDAKGDTNRGITIGERRVHRAQHDPVVQERRHHDRRGREHRLQLRDLLGQPGDGSGATRCWPRTATSSAATTTSAIPSQPVLAQGRRPPGVVVGAGAWLGAGAKILDGVTIGDGAIIGAGGGGPRRRPGRRDRGRHPGAGSSARARRAAQVSVSAREAERPPGLRSPRLGRVAHARRQAPVRVDDPALRSGALQRVARQPAQEGPLGGNARVVRHRHHLPAQVEVRSGDAAGAAEDHRPQADRHPAPARLRRDDVRAAGRRRCGGSRRSCTSTRT